MQGMLDPSEFCESRTLYGDPFLQPIPGRIRFLLSTGFTVRIRYANLFFPELQQERLNAAGLSDLLPLLGEGGVRVNLYLADAYARAVSVHADRRHSIVAGLWGAKEWSLSNNAYPSGTPYLGYMPDLHTRMMRAGDAFFIPEGMLHAVLPVTPSCHATITRGFDSTIEVPDDSVWMALQSLVHACNEALASDLPREPTHTFPVSDHLRDRNSIEKWVALLQVIDIRVGDVSALSAGQSSPIRASRSRRMENTLQVESSVDWDAMSRHINKEGTVAVGGMQRWLSGLADPLVAGASIYISGPNAPGGLPHTDLGEVIVVQLAGSKYWYVGETGQKFCIAPGDMFRIPAGTLHRAESGSSGSVHLAILRVP